MPARWRYILGEVLVGLRRNLLMTVAVVLSVAVSLTLVGAAVLLRDQVELAAGYWTGRIEVSIFLCDGRTCPAITPEQQAALEQALRAEPVVAEVYYESKEEAYQRFREQFRNQPDLVETVTPDVLPASFRVKLHDPEQFEVIRDRFQAMPGVEEIVDQRDVLKEFFRITDVFRVGALTVALIQLVAAMVLIANTIRIAAYARREQIAIMRLVGASNWYIRLPFVLEGTIAGFVGSLVAWVLLLVSVPRITSYLSSTITLTPFIGIREALLVAVWLFPIGVGISALASTVALRRFLDV